ncbi:MAG: RidA family protein [Betaproteobacteria bacterium]|nr:MAG: RidA family protein [Betaproteobacteria bacterium]
MATHWKSHTPPSIYKPLSTYNHAIELPPGARILESSGQLPVRVDGSWPDGIAAQTQLVWENVLAILQSADMGVEHLVRVKTFLIHREHMAEYSRVRSGFLGDCRPASTLLIVSGFTRPEWLVEVEITAAKVD